MCGINLLISQSSQAAGILDQMMKVTSSRGPDAQGTDHLENKVYLGCSRLRITDLSPEADMPFWSKCRNYVLVWNGVLYNYPELKKNLEEKGRYFLTGSDTEVLLYHLILHGKSGIEKLNGMFAFAFVDIAKKEILIARDYSGEKPLYYSRDGNSWAFSSASKAILAGTNPEIDVAQFYAYFHYRFPYTEGSFYKNVCQVSPGSGFVLDFEGRIKEELKFEVPVSELVTTSFEPLLIAALRKALLSDRKVGMILSGGADSSLLYALHYELTGQSIPTFTAALESKYHQHYSDPHFAKYLIKKYPSEHHEIAVSFTSFQEHWEDYIGNLDQPVGDSSAFLCWMIGLEATAHTKVLLSGAGADELFGGYNRHKAFLFYLNNPRIFKLLKQFGNQLPLPYHLKKFIGSLGKDHQETFINMAALYPLAGKEMEYWKARFPIHADPYKAALAWDRMMYLPNDVLKVNDNSFMMHGIEVRSPYLNADIIGAAGSSPADQLVGKKWIRHSLVSRGLSAIANRKKLGFGLPLYEWSQQKQYLTWISGPIIEMEKQWGEYFPKPMQHLAAAPQKAGKEHFLLLYNLFVLATWLKKNR